MIKIYLFPVGFNSVQFSSALPGRGLAELDDGIQRLY